MDKLRMRKNQGIMDESVKKSTNKRRYGI